MFPVISSSSCTMQSSVAASAITEEKETKKSLRVMPSSEKKIPQLTEGEAEKKLSNALKQIQHNKIKQLNLSLAHFGRFYEQTEPFCTLRGHQNHVMCLAALPNGQLASGSGDKTIKLWDFASRSCAFTLQGHTGPIYALSVLPNGLLASSSNDKTIKLWNLFSHSCLSTLEGHTGPVTDLAVLSNSLLASGSGDKTIKLWDLASSSCLSTLQGHTDAVLALAVLPNGQLASGSMDCTIKLWNLTSRTRLSTLQGHTAWVLTLSALPNGQLACGSIDGTIKLWDLTSRTCLSTLRGHTGYVRAFAVFPNGLLASGSNDKTIKLWGPKMASLCVKQVQPLLDALRKNTSVTQLDLSGNLQITDPIIDPLRSLLAPSNFSEPKPNRTLKKIDLQRTGVTKIGAQKLQKCLQALSLPVEILTDWKEAETLEAKLEKERMPETLRKMEEQKKQAQPQQQLVEEARKKELAQQAALQKEEAEKRKKAEKRKRQPKKQLEKEAKEKKSAHQPNLPKKGKSKRLRKERQEMTLQQQASEAKDVKESKEKKEQKENAPQSSYLIDYARLELGKKLGEGGFGAVYKGQYNFEEVAVKKLLMDQMTKESETEFKNEVSIMAQLKHPNIVAIYGYTISPYCMVMELMHTSLFDVLQNEQDLPWKNRMVIVMDITAGLLQLHDANILHRDLKSLNILLTSTMRAKLADFGLSKVKTETKTRTGEGGMGSLAWMAPELLDIDSVYSKASDIYAYGMVLWEIASRQVPYRGSHKAVIMKKVCEGGRPKIPNDCPLKLASLIPYCWHKTPSKRPSIKEIGLFLKSNDEEFKPSAPD